MKKLVLILLLLTPVRAFTQTHTFTDKEVVEMDSRIDLYMDLTKELRPKWYNKPAIHFFLGAATIITSSWVVSNIN